MLQQLWDGIVKTLREGCDGERAAVIASVGSRRYYKRGDGSLIELARRMNLKTVVSTPDAFTTAFLRRWAPSDDEQQPLAFVGDNCVIAVDSIEPEASFVAQAAPGIEPASDKEPKSQWVFSSNVGNGRRREVRMPLVHSESWVDLCGVLKASFTQKELLANRARFQAWLSAEDLPIWLRFWRNLKASVTTTDGLAGEGGLVLDETSSRRTEIKIGVPFTPLREVEEGTPPSVPGTKDFFEPFKLSCKLFNWSDKRTEIEVIVDVDPNDAKKYRLRPIGNAIAEAELNARIELAKKLTDDLKTDVILGNGEEFSTTDL